MTVILVDLKIIGLRNQSCVSNNGMVFMYGFFCDLCISVLKGVSVVKMH